MNDLQNLRRAALFLGIAAVVAMFDVTVNAVDPPIEWPRVVVRGRETNTVYQPQLESWDYSTLKARAAVAMQPVGSSQTIFGTIVIQARSEVDRAQRTVYLDQLQIIEGNFPSAPDKEALYLERLRSMLPKEIKSFSLDRLEAGLAVLEAREKSKSQPLKNDPPAIIFSSKAAMAIPVDGPAVFRNVEGTDLERVFNTRALILRDKSGKIYLHLFDGYVEAPALGGPWTVAQELPSDIKKAEKKAISAKQVDLLAGQENPDTKKKPSLKTDPLPALYLTTTPTELIVTMGEPQWTPLPPTQLLYVTNSSAHVFKLLTDQKTYVLISGRWFRSSGFDGPWEFVPGDRLSKDFADIPDDSPVENIKASVPGTRQAEEAVIANGIPQTVKVNRKKAKMDPPPQYDGPVLLKPIENTPLLYVANCATPVIQVSADSWYACQNGVWFVATSSDGPWKVATSVPASIYSIPPSSPVHYVVYSRIINFDDDFVWVGTTPGYYGTILASDGVVVYGTGYYYPPYLGTTTYVSYCVTYGYACNPCWTPWAGWAFGFSVGWATAYNWYWWYGCPPAPYWGPYWYSCYGAYYNAYGGITAWGPYGWAGTSGYIYHQNGPWTGVSRTAAGYNAWTGNRWATQYGRAYNSTTGTRAVGQRGAVENVYTGNYAYGGRGAAYNPNSGAAAAGGKVTWGNEATGNQGTAGRGTIYNPNTGNTTKIAGVKGENAGAISVNGNVIVGKDGNYYRPDGSGGWDQVTRPEAGNRPSTGAAAAQGATGQSQWSNMQRSTMNQDRMQSLDNQYRSQQWGAQRQQSFQRHQPAFRGGGGGGGRRR